MIVLNKTKRINQIRVKGNESEIDHFNFYESETTQLTFELVYYICFCGAQ